MWYLIYVMSSETDPNKLIMYPALAEEYARAELPNRQTADVALSHNLKRVADLSLKLMHMDDQYDRPTEPLVLGTVNETEFFIACKTLGYTNNMVSRVWDGLQSVVPIGSRDEEGSFQKDKSRGVVSLSDISGFINNQDKLNKKPVNKRGHPTRDDENSRYIGNGGIEMLVDLLENYGEPLEK